GTPSPSRGRPPRPSPHAVLGVKPGATVSEVRAAYREKAMEYHPDRVATLAPEFKRIAEQRMRDINAAYEELLRLAAAQR
ncbi:MAG TPA: J domain-containing protein, partial [Candidatus Thermoplasmatota archaeon]|nr:J domain-containing protein [Candidatus Thermoplasmatota archaeon]